METNKILSERMSSYLKLDSVFQAEISNNSQVMQEIVTRIKSMRKALPTLNCEDFEKDLVTFATSNYSVTFMDQDMKYNVAAIRELYSTAKLLGSSFELSEQEDKQLAEILSNFKRLWSLDEAHKLVVNDTESYEFLMQGLKNLGENKSELNNMFMAPIFQPNE